LTKLSLFREHLVLSAKDEIAELLTRTATMENISLCGPMKSNCVCGIATGDTRVRGEFDFVTARAEACARMKS
jgi:hypothetical protein